VLSLYRRHLKRCPHRDKGRAWPKCSCPIWADGELHGKRYRKSLGLRDWARAGRKLAELEDPNTPQLKAVPEAVTDFGNHIRSLEPSTQRKYMNTLRQFRDHCGAAGVEDVLQIGIEHLDAYRAGRDIARTTAQRELEVLRQFLDFCRDRNWTADNPARRIKPPKGIKPAEVTPYTPEEVARIIAACDLVGRGTYERLRARAMVLLLRHTGLRVGDVATLARDRVRDRRIYLHTLKTGAAVLLPVEPELQTALDALPDPRGAGKDARYYFWNGVTSKRAVVGIAERTLTAVFRKARVPGAHAHRFRHTLATELLGLGGSEQDVADILGNSPAIVRKHYAKWSRARQERITNLMEAAFSGTRAVHGEKAAVIH